MIFFGSTPWAARVRLGSKLQSVPIYCQCLLMTDVHSASLVVTLQAPVEHVITGFEASSFESAAAYQCIGNIQRSYMPSLPCRPCLTLASIVYGQPTAASVARLSDRS